MIVTVTMNPAIDKTVEIGRLNPGGLNRIHKMEYDAGGKGINVSKTIKELGGKSIAVGFLGGNTGRTIEAVLKEQGICCDFVYVDGKTRINTKVVEASGAVTELNEPGPMITKDKISELLYKLETYAGKETLFVLSGSVPKDVKDDIYERIIRLVHKKGAKVLLDADGELFRKALSARPDMIKPNVTEIESYVGSDESVTKEQMAELAADFLNRGVEMVLISMGADGAVFFWKDGRIESPALMVKAHSTVGAGDAMVAALAFSWERRLDREEMVRLCMAASAGAVMTIGTKPPCQAVVEALKKQVILKK